MRLIFFSLLIINLIYYGISVISSSESTFGENRSDLTVDPYPRAEKIMLLSEKGKVGQSGVSRSAQESLEEPNLDIKSKLCPSIGPFYSKNRANAFVRSLGAYDFESELVEVLKAPTKEYWVKSDPMKTPEEALSEIRRLQQQGIEGYLVTGNTGEQLVSVGVYPSMDEAKKVQLTVNELGLVSSIIEKLRDNREYWIKINQSNSIKALKTQLEPMLIEFNGVLFSQILCE